MGGRTGGSGLDGTGESGAEGPAGPGGGGRGRPGGNTGDTEDSELGGTSGHTEDSGLGGTSGHTEDSGLGGTSGETENSGLGGTSGETENSWLDGTSGNGAEEMTGGGRSGRLRGYTGESGLDGTSGETGKLGITSIDQSIRSRTCSIRSSETVYSSPSVAGVWAGLSSTPSISTRTPTMHGVAGSHTWSVALSRSCSLSVDCSGSAAAVGSGSVRRDGGWLVSGSGVGLARSSMGQTVRGDPFLARVHSTNAAKSSRGPSSDDNALHLEFRLVL